MVHDEHVDRLDQIVQASETGRSKLSALRLFRNMFGLDSEATLTKEELDELLTSGYVLSEFLDEISIENGQAGFSEFVAEIFEDVGNVFPSRALDSSLISLLTRSAISYVVTRKFANAQLIARQALREFPEVSDGGTTIEQFRLLLQRAVLMLISSRLEDLRAVANPDRLGVIGSDLLEHTDGDPEEIATGLMLLRSIYNFSMFLDRNDQGFLTNAKSDLDNAARLGRRELYLGEVSEWIRLLFDAWISSYAPTHISNLPGISDAYVQTLLNGDRPLHFLWPPQIAAIENGLMDHDRFALSFPPSAGKTLLAELKIVSTISASRGLAIYVVPLNALARQAQDELARRLRQSPTRFNIKVLTGIYEIGDEELDVAGLEPNVIITTPEKLDALLRNMESPEIRAMFDRVKLFVFDECQTIGTGKRGITYELLIERIKSQFQEVSILGTAALFENIDIFAD